MAFCPEALSCRQKGLGGPVAALPETTRSDALSSNPLSGLSKGFQVRDRFFFGEAAHRPVVSLTHSMKRQLAEWSPRYFCPRDGAEELHTAYLELLVQDFRYAQA